MAATKFTGVIIALNTERSADPLYGSVKTVTCFSATLVQTKTVSLFTINALFQLMKSDTTEHGITPHSPHSDYSLMYHIIFAITVQECNTADCTNTKQQRELT